MDNLGKRLEEVRAEVQVHWTEERARRVARSLHRRRRRQAALRAVSGVAALFVLLFTVRAVLRLPGPEKEGVTPIARPSRLS